MSKQGTRLTQDPRVMLAVVAVLVAMVAINLREFLPAGAAADLAVSEDEETLLPPADLRRVGAALRACLAAPPDSLSEPLPVTFARNPFAYSAVTLASPPPVAMAPAGQPLPAAGPRFHCSAVILAAGGVAAIIDGRMVGIGERVGDYRVESISEDGVTLRAGERTRVLAVKRARGEGAIGAPVGQAPVGQD
jgi:hypothetical protein